MKGEKKGLGLLPLALVMAALFLVRCSSVPQASNPGLDSPQTGVFSFLFATSRGLEFEPCGCSLRPLGGVRREGNWLQSADKPQGKILAFTSGITFVPMPYQNNLKAYADLKSGFLVDALNHLSTSGVSPSVVDF